MFTFKKTDKGEPNVDLEQLHSTNELHYATDEKTKCIVCKNPFKDGEICGILEMEGDLEIAHERCPDG